MTTAAIERVARQIASAIPPPATLPPVQRGLAVVQSGPSGTPPTVTVTFGGSSTPVAGVLLLDHVNCGPGDTVLVDHVDSQPYISGRVSDGRGQAVGVVNTGATAYGPRGGRQWVQAFSWVGAIAGDSSVVIPFPAAFTGFVASIIATPGDVAGSLGQLQVYEAGITLAQFKAYAEAANGGNIAGQTVRVNVIAVGGGA